MEHGVVFSEFCLEHNDLENPNDSQKQSYRHIKKFGAMLATQLGKSLELISFGWSGGRSNKAREDGATFLAQYLDRAYKNTDRIFIGHSHGNNLISAATHDASMENNPAKLLVYFACPQRPEDQYKPKNFEQLVYFTSHDWIDKGGGIPEGFDKFILLSTSVLTGSLIAPKLLPQSTTSAPETQKLITAMQCAAAAKFAIGAAHGIRLRIRNNGLQPQKSKIVVCVDTKHDGVGPDHSSIFYNSVKHLPEIIYRLQTEHPENFAKSGIFYVDIQNNKDSGNNADLKVNIAVKKPGKMEPIQFIKFIPEKSNINNNDNILTLEKNKKQALSKIVINRSQWELLALKPEYFGMTNTLLSAVTPVKEIDNLSSFKALKEFEIRKRHRFVPESISDSGEMTMTLVHGTSEREDKNYFADDDRQSAYRDIQELGFRLAKQFGKPLEVISFGWSGNNSHKARMASGDFLAEYLNRAYPNTDRIFIGHGHGSNLVNIATNAYSMKSNPAKLLIYFGCPQKIENYYKPKYFKQLIYFTSHDNIEKEEEHIQDLTEFVTLPIKYIKALKQGKALDPQDGKIITTLHTKHSGRYPNHSELFRNTTKHLPEILNCLQSDYADNYAKSGSFDLDIQNGKVNITVNEPGKMCPVADFTKFVTEEKEESNGNDLK